MAKKKEKVIASLRISKHIGEALEELAIELGYGEKSIGEMLKIVIWMHLDPYICKVLEPELTPRAYQSLSDFEDLCAMFVKYSRAKRKVPGYKAVIGKSIDIHEGDDENAKFKEGRKMPFKIAYFETPEDK